MPSENGLKVGANSVGSRYSTRCFAAAVKDSGSSSNDVTRSCTKACNERSAWIHTTTGLSPTNVNGEPVASTIGSIGKNRSSELSL